MGYWCSVAIALWKPDYNELVLKAKENEAVKGSAVEKMIANAIPVRTPDETYMILNIDWDKWYSDTDAHKFLKNFYKHIRHSALVIGEDNQVETDIKIDDDRGVDEEFGEILEISLKVAAFGKEIPI